MRSQLQHIGLKRYTSNHANGSVLLYVLWFVVVLSVLVTGVARSARLNSRLSQGQYEQVRLSWAAKGGIEKSIAILGNDLTASDSQLDEWYQPHSLAMSQCDISLKIRDESSKLNVNVATLAQLKSFTNIDDSIAGAIIDWRDSDGKVHSGGAESAYYSELEPPYRIRNGHIRTIRELLLVKDISKEILFGEDTNLNGKLDANENDGDQTEPYDNGDGNLDQGLAAWVTCYSYHDNSKKLNLKSANEQEIKAKLGVSTEIAKWLSEKKPGSLSKMIHAQSPETPEKAKGGELDLETFEDIIDKITFTDDEYVLGLVNVNTASYDVLYALCKGDEGIAKDIVSLREEQGGAITSIADIYNGSIGIKSFNKIADYITVESKVFSVQSNATSQATGRVFTTEAILDRRNKGTEIMYWYQGVRF